MRALTLWEPFASCIACGAKKIETRTYPTRYKGTLLIHAAIRPINSYGDSLLADLKAAGIDININPGHIVAQAKMVRCVQMTEEYINQQTEVEKKLGHWFFGNYAWILEDIKPISPIFVKGLQGLWIPKASVLEQLDKTV